MKVITYEESEKRLIELDKIAHIKEDVYLNALRFVASASGDYINNVNFQIYILFANEIQFDFDHNETDKYCKFELRNVRDEFQVTVFMYENRNTYPIIEDVSLEDIFSTVKQFFK
jgi:hypothetical protein